MLQPAEAGRLILEDGGAPSGFTRFLALLTCALYGIYGTSMGLFLGIGPSLVSGLKLPFLYGFSLIVCYFSLYHLNALIGPRLTRRQTMQLLLFALSANAVALASYAPFSYFFTLTSSREAYQFLVLMHVVVFGAAGIISVIEVALIFRATARLRNVPLRPQFVLAWAVLYAFVGTQMAWVLRPWIGARDVEYQIIRPIEGSFIEAVWRLLQNL